ncbi:MAG TPA: amylo-alpha-1,6-glucosidase [Terracidiphilus sp.]|jgi:glycogen debranching enzyme
MHGRTMSSLLFAVSFAITIATQAQQPTPVFSSIPAIPFDTSSPVIRAHTETEKPFTVAGERAVVLGQQNGIFEAWALPVKVLSHMTIEADIEGYTVPIDVNQQASEIEVRPDRTIITYSHIGFTVRQIMFSPDNVDAGTGPVVLYEFDCLHPTDFIFRFTPELRWMWPERNEGVPGPEWIAGPNAAPTAKEPGPEGAVSGVPLPNHGYYVLHADYPDLAAAVTIPGAQPGILAPYQERPQVHPVEFHLHIDPARDRGKLFPLLMAVGMSKESATNAALGATLEHLNHTIAELYKAKDDSYKKLLANSVSIETPDKTLNQAFQWAVVSIEQLKTKALSKTGDDETALVAGYYASADSARPGFGWFFGRDALYTLYAVNGYGDFALSKSELEFLIKRQREDGKIMHEYSQTAAFIDWRQFPYMYAAADSTPLFLLAVADYVKASGDVAFLSAHRDAIEKAWAFETDPAHDTDHDGIYDNSQGTGWVESWPGGMPHQEIYLALLDQQASSAIGYIEALMKDSNKAQSAQARADKLAKTINAEYWDPQKNCYAFSRNMDGSQDKTSTVYPALAWWDPAGGKSILVQPEGCLSQLAEAKLNTDWGLRDVANDEKFYDGMSYHQGSVWPLFTGWAALAEYRAGQPLAGYQILMENANLTQAQDLGSVTELLSGDFFVPFGRSTSHQLWSSAMVITPILRGLFGISIDAQSKTITVNPHLPASWDHAAINHLPIGEGKGSLTFTRSKGSLRVALSSDHEELTGWQLREESSGAKSGNPSNGQIAIQTNQPEHAISEDADKPPIPGSRTEKARVLSAEMSSKRTRLTIEGRAGSMIEYRVTQPDRVMPRIQVSDGLSVNADSEHPGVALHFADSREMSDGAPLTMVIVFPPGEGWKTITVTLTW